MTRNQLKFVSIAPGADQAGLSKEQKTFNSLIKQIEKRRATLRDWEAITPHIQKKVLDELLPLVKTSQDMLAGLVRAMDQAHDLKGLTKTERRMLSKVIAVLAGDLAEKLDDAELKAIYNRHSDLDFDSELAANVDAMKQTVEDMFGLDLGEDIASFEDVLGRAQDHIEQKMRDEETRDSARKEQKSKQRKKTAKQIAAEEKARTEQAQLSLSIREVYRKLASALHPDRETDLAERKRKTLLMQQVNQAYEKHDLLRLLELQLELEHIDQAAIDNINESRLTHYNKILKGQIGELDRELLDVEARFRDQFNLNPFEPLTPKSASRSLAAEIKGVRGHIRHIESDMLACQDIKQLKKRLKLWHQEISMRDFDAELQDIPF
ncbi:J domain-containing protein [Dyella subtropica]|uniref:J domain-containing protein n=1 Tax=Dyella subtropica TaxID=2992127 RepID=UPI002254BD20|nr:J domain-containing protein [Dyella subtropica]